MLFYAGVNTACCSRIGSRPYMLSKLVERLREMCVVHTVYNVLCVVYCVLCIHTLLNPSKSCTHFQVFSQTIFGSILPSPPSPVLCNPQFPQFPRMTDNDECARLRKTYGAFMHPSSHYISLLFSSPHYTALQWSAIWEVCADQWLLTRDHRGYQWVATLYTLPANAGLQAL